MPRVIVGDGPLRGRVPDALGFVPRAELVAHYERAAVVVCPSHREGYGVVAQRGDGARSARGRDRGRWAPRRHRRRRDGPPRPAAGPGRAAGAIETLLSDAELRRRLGAAARKAARERFSWQVSTERTLAAYRDALQVRSPAGAA